VTILKIITPQNQTIFTITNI